MGPHIMPAGWREWQPGTTHRLDTAYYREFDSLGAGSNIAERAHLTAAQAQRYTVPLILGGADHWNPLAQP